MWLVERVPTPGIPTPRPARGLKGWGLAFGVWGLGFRVEGLGVGVSGVGFRV